MRCVSVVFGIALVVHVEFLFPSQYAVSCHQRSASETPFEWRFAGWPMVAGFKMFTWLVLI